MVEVLDSSEILDTLTDQGYRELAAEPSRLWVIGDIHGCFDELSVLLNHLRQVEKLSTADQVVFVGDYIDRGPGSRAVVDMLIDFQAEFPETIFLKGNHEDMLLNFLGEPGHLGQGFLVNGGVQTLKSYGLVDELEPAALEAALSEAHWQFYRSLDRYVIGERYVIVHAGLNPLRDLYEQVDEELFWIRNEFLQNLHYFDKTVIFGHTPHREIFYDLPYKIGIDTGLVYGYKLSCVELLAGKVLQVKRGARKVKVGRLKS